MKCCAKKTVNFRQKTYYRARVTKKWITTVAKFRKKHPLTRAISRIHVLWVLDTEKLNDGKTPVRLSVRPPTTLAAKPFSRFSPKLTISNHSFIIVKRSHRGEKVVSAT